MVTINLQLLDWKRSFHYTGMQNMPVNRIYLREREQYWTPYTTTMKTLTVPVMSRRRKVDYASIFEKVKSLVPYPSDEEVVNDFERAKWAAVKSSFFQVSHFGCSFHWVKL